MKEISQNLTGRERTWRIVIRMAVSGVAFVFPIGKRGAKRVYEDDESEKESKCWADVSFREFAF